MLLCPKVEDTLAVDGDQEPQLSTAKDRMEFQLENLSGDSGSLVDRSKEILAASGQSVRDILSDDQDAKLQVLFESGTLEPLEVRLVGDGSPSLRGSAVYRRIEILYTDFGRPVIAGATAQRGAGEEMPEIVRGFGDEPQKVRRTRRNRLNSDIPDGCTKTDIVGGSGGSAFVAVKTANDQVIGFNASLADWMGHRIVHKLEPIYASATDSPPTGTDVLLANDGYIVGGLVVDSDDCVNAFRVIYVRHENGLLEANKSYMSDWFGVPTGHFQQTLGNNGQPVVGIFGRSGMNLDAVGLVQAQ